MHTEFFGIISQKPEYVKSVCNNRKNHFHSACRICIFDKQSN